MKCIPSILTGIIVEHRELPGHLVQTIGERLKVQVREDVINPSILVQVLLDAQYQVVDRVWRVLTSIGLSHLLHEQAQGVVQLFRGQRQQV